MSNEKAIPDAPEPCPSYSNTEASCWQSGWESGYQAALAQQSEPHINATDICSECLDLQCGGDCVKPSQVSQELQQEVNAKETGLLISKVARLEAENARLQREIKWLINECFESGVSVRVRSVIAEIEKELK